MEAELASEHAGDLGSLTEAIGGEVRITAPEFLGAAVIAEGLGRLSRGASAAARTSR